MYSQILLLATEIEWFYVNLLSNYLNCNLSLSLSVRHAQYKLEGKLKISSNFKIAI